MLIFKLVVYAAMVGSIAVILVDMVKIFKGSDNDEKQ